MNKLITAILAVLYLGTSAGATVHLHYCMSKLSDWEFGHSKSKTCSKCGMEKSDEKDNGCCKDEHKFIKNETDQKAAETGFQLMQLVAIALPVSFVEVPAVTFPSIEEENPVSNSPPRSAGVAVYIRNRTFLI